MINFKSTITKKTDIDYTKSFVIEQLFADPKMIETHVTKLKEVYKNASDAFIRNQVDNIIIKENAFNQVMTYLVTCFDFKFDDVEVATIQSRIKTQMTHLNDEQTKDLASKLVQKGLVFNVLSQENKIDVSDDDVKQYLDQYYQSTNNSINQYLNDQQKFNEIKNIILEEKITQWVINKFKISLTIQNVLNRQVPMNEQPSKPNPFNLKQ